MSLNLFPARAAIGRASVNGQTVDIFMTPEFSRALADLSVRVGGADGVDNSQIVALLKSLTLQINGVDAEIEAIGAQVSTIGATVEASTVDAAMTVDYGARVTALAGRIDELAAEVESLSGAPDVSQQLADISVLLNMQDVKPAAVKGTVTGSRSANAALASLLTVLAKGGYIIDSTVV